MGHSRHKQKHNHKHKNISSRSIHHSDQQKHYKYCRGKQGPPGPMGPPGQSVPPGLFVPPDLFVPSCLFVPFIINHQTKIIDPIEITEPDGETVVNTINVTIPTDWNTYDLIISGEIFADETDVHTGVVMNIRQGNTINGSLIGSQVLGYNGTAYLNGIGFSGYHKEILNNQSIKDNITFCLTVKAIDNVRDQICDTVVINRYLHLQAIRQS